MSGLLSARVPGHDLIILAGGPGSGKSTLCRVLASRLAKLPDLHPVFLRLRRVQEGTDMTTFIEDSLRRAGLIDRLADLRNVPNVILILDGFDELIMSSKNRLRQVFNQLRDELSVGPLAKAKVLVSGRDTLFPGGEGFPIGSHVLILQPFDRARVAAWGEAWRAVHPSGLGARFRPERLLREGEDAAVAEGDSFPLEHLARWPLTLHLLAQIHTAGRLDVSTNSEAIERAYLYRAILAETSERQQQQAEGAGRLDPERMRRFLRELAWAMYRRSTDSMEPRDVIPILGSYFADANESDLSELADIAIVNAPELARGEETGFEFVHKSFSEFLVAEHVAEIVERICFKAREYGVADETWRMGELDASKMLADAVGFRLLTAEVQDMLEPMLGSLDHFMGRARVDEQVEREVMQAGSQKVLTRMSDLYKLAITGYPLPHIAEVARNWSSARSPLEAYANYCAGIVVLGTAAARRLTASTTQATHFALEPAPGYTLRLLSIFAAGDLQVDPNLAQRLYEGSSMRLQRLEEGRHEALRDADLTHATHYLRSLDGFEPVVAQSFAELFGMHVLYRVMAADFGILREYRSEFRHRVRAWEEPVLRIRDHAIGDLAMALGRAGFLTWEEVSVFREIAMRIDYMLERGPRFGDFEYHEVMDYLRLLTEVQAQITGPLGNSFDVVRLLTEVMRRGGRFTRLREMPADSEDPTLGIQ
nr:NACHT domain-containing protein [Geodermatophilus normandii]